VLYLQFLKTLTIFKYYSNRLPKIWFYQLKGKEHLSTPKEKNIADKLPLYKAINYLESRALLRKSLSEIFNLDPLEIPIDAKPGMPPKLPKNMGNISMSHCKDALIIAWGSKKIGIDIEKLDRDFDYKSLAKKYFHRLTKEKSFKKFNKKEILNEWCAIESAIKWDHGKISKDIKKWVYNKDEKVIIHKNKKIKLNLEQFDFFDWTVSLAYKKLENINLYSIICTNN